MNAAIYQTVWHELSAWALENETLRTIVVPELGAKLVSLFDKRNQLEWLAGSGDRPFRPVAYGATFTDQDMSGWDEMFPTITACAYPGDGDRHGIALPDHGEVWVLPWSLDKATDGRLTFSVEGQALPYRLTRTAELSDEGTLHLKYQMINRSAHCLPYLWAAHPQFICGREAEVIFPAHVNTVCNSLAESWGWGAPETRFDWPLASALDGTPVRLDRIGPPTRHQARKFFVPPDVQVDWAELRLQPSRAWLRLHWDAQRVPYLGLWVDEGVFNPESVVALEPMTGYYDTLTVAWGKQRVALAEPGETHEWALTVRVGTGEQPFPTK